MASTSDPQIGGGDQATVKRRLVLNFPGFEKTDSDAQLGRLKHGAEQTGKVWQFSVDQKSITPIEDHHHSIADMSAAGENWRTDVRIVQFRWNDIVHVYENSPFPLGFLRDFYKFSAFFLDGTVWRYLKASSRYFSFTIFPILLLIIFAGLSWFVAGYLTDVVLLKLVFTALATLVLCKWPGDRFYVPLTIADWGFARDMINHSNTDIEDRFEEFAKTLGKEIAGSDHDEIVVVGHSFGAVWAVSALARAITANEKMLKGKQVTFLALGSSIAKIALAPKAQFLRDHVKKVVEQSEVFWHEVQTKDDLIAFYKCDPFEILDIVPDCDVKIDRIRFSKGIEKKRYRSLRRSVYRTHRQYILYYDKRVDFDYMLRLFGPLSARELAGEKDTASRIDNNGRLLY